MRYQRRNSTLPSLLADIFSNNISQMVGGDMTENIPSVNVSTDDDKYSLFLAVPGVAKEDINLKIEKGQFIISAATSNDETATYTKREFDYSSFRKSFTLPEDVDREGITASYEDGVLRVDFSRIAQEELEIVKKIEIK